MDAQDGQDFERALAKIAENAKREPQKAPASAKASGTALQFSSSVFIREIRGIIFVPLCLCAFVPLCLCAFVPFCRCFAFFARVNSSSVLIL